MAYLRKSLSEDSVDRYSHTWAFLFLLLLSLITLLIPLSPSLNSSSQASPGRSSTKGDNKGYPTFTPACWLPVRFTPSMSAYAHVVCSAAYNDIVQGRNSSTARLLIRDEYDIPTDHPGDDIGEKQLFFSEKSRKIREEQTKQDRRTKDLVSYKAPLYLFVLALLLRLPHAIWSLLTTCCGCVNVDRTLAAAQTAQSLDSDGQQRVYEEIVLGLGGPRKKATGLLYLLMKLLMVVVACVGIYCASHDFLAETEDLQKHSSGKSRSNQGTGIGISYFSRQSVNKTDVHNLQDYPVVLFCGFEITQLQNVQRWLIQCIFTPDDVRSTSGLNANHGMGDDDVKLSEDQILLMYKALFTSVLSVFVVLLMLNVISLLAWCLTLLLSGHRTRMGVKAEATLDFVFLVAMARQNTSCFVVRELAKLSAERLSDKQLMLN